MSVAANSTPAESEQAIYSFLRTAYGLPDPIAKIITAQSGHETAGWTSNIFESLNNAFGFGFSGGGNYYGYNSIEESVSDVVNWLSNNVPGFQNLSDPDQYATAIRAKGYYTDSETNYAQGIWNFLNDNLQLVAGVSIAALVGIGLMLYFIFKK